MKTETVTVIPKGEDFKIIVQHDQSGSLPVEDIKKAIFQFKKECLPDAEAPFHYEAEIWAGMQSFIRWLESKGNDC